MGRRRTLDEWDRVEGDRRGLWLFERQQEKVDRDREAKRLAEERRAARAQTARVVGYVGDRAIVTHLRAVTLQEAEEIRQARAAGETVKELAEKHELSQAYILRIIKNKVLVA